MRGFCGRSDPFFAQRLDEHVHQERHSSRRAQAGIDEERIRSAGELRLHKLGNGGSRQGRQADQLRGRIGRQRRKQLGIRTCLGRV